MKKIFTLLTGCFFAIASCIYSPTYTVQGTLPDSGFDGETIYILRYDDNRFIDSTIVSGKDFIFEGVADTPVYCRIQAGRTYYTNFILENGEIVVDFNKHRATSTTPLNKVYNKMEGEIEKLKKEWNKKTEEIQTLTKEAVEIEKLKKEYYETHVKKEYTALYKSFFRANNNNAVGMIALHECYQMASPEEMDSLFSEAGSWILSRETVKRLITINDAVKNTAEGNLFLDFTVEEESGVCTSFSDFIGKGKSVLVVFWASWSGPSIQIIPTLDDIYEEYSNKEIEILGVSMWDRLTDTQKALEQYDIKWPQIKNAQDVPADLYGITTLPYIMLFGPDSTILARDLNAEELNEKLKEISGKVNS